MILYKEDKKFSEHKFHLEKDFEEEISKNNKLFFGKNTIYIDAKKRIDTKFLGGSIPDAFLFDLSDIENPEFYMVEVELKIHDFYKHIFPQITKFIAFLGNSQKELIDKIYNIIDRDNDLKETFKKIIGNKEIYKYISDTIENSQHILLIIDGEKDELSEMIDTYTEWAKLVKIQVIKKFIFQNAFIYTMEPEFEKIEYSQIETTNNTGGKQYSEEYHLEGLNQNVKDIYNSLKRQLCQVNADFVFNPQKYYISVKTKKNIIYFELRKKKIRLIMMMHYDEVKKIIKKNQIVQLSPSVQSFYNGDCVAIILEDVSNIDEIVELSKALIKKS